ncbi:unnamed protein product [Effrenium voratum]|nr:unnamed protein product [Effrenium voratum]
MSTASRVSTEKDVTRPAGVLLARGGTVLESFTDPDPVMYLTSSRAACGAKTDLWRATRKSAASRPRRKMWYPEDEVPASRLRAQEEEWRKLLKGRTQGSCASRSSGSKASVSTACPAGVSNEENACRQQREGCFLWRSQAGF